MRITVGGILIVSAAGAFVFAGPLKPTGFSFLQSHIEGVKDSAGWVYQYFQSKISSQPSAPPEVPPLQIAEPVPLVEPLVENIPTAPVETPVVVEAAPSQAVVSVAAEKPPVVKKTRTKRRRAKRIKSVPAVSAGSAASAVKAAAQVPSAAKAASVAQAPSGGDKLMGTYVALKLKSGRDVKGILEGKNAKEYTLSIPGLGPLKYPVENVVSVSAVE